MQSLLSVIINSIIWVHTNILTSSIPYPWRIVLHQKHADNLVCSCGY